MPNRRYPMESFYNIETKPIVMNFNSHNIDEYLQKWNASSNIIRKQDYDGTYTMPRHWHPELEINYINKGSVDSYYLNGKVVKRTTEEMMIVNSYEVHGLDCVSFDEETQFLTVIFPLEFVRNYCPELMNYTYDLPKVEKMNAFQQQSYEKLKHIFDEIVALKQERDSKTPDFVYTGLVLQVAGILVAAFSDERTELPGCEEMILLDSILCYIHQHYKERLPLAKIAKEVNVSVSHLSKFFKDYTGYTVSNYIERVRSMHAIDELKKGNGTVMDVALNNGFTDAKSLNRVLKRDYDKSAKMIVQETSFSNF